MRNTKCVSKRFSSNEWPAPGALRWCLKATGWMDRLTLPPHWDSFCWMCLVFAWLSKYCSDEETGIAETDLLWRFPTNRCQRRARRAAPAFGSLCGKRKPPAGSLLQGERLLLPLSLHGLSSPQQSPTFKLKAPVLHQIKISSILCPIKCCPNSLFSPFFTAFCKTAASFYLAKGPRQEGTHTAVNKSIVTFV